MEITRTTDYAIRTVLHMAAFGNGRRVTAAEISKAQQIPHDYVPKVVQTLSRAGLVITTPGRTGGMRLGRAPEQITVLDVVEAMEGPITLNRCQLRRHECPRDRTCPVHPMWAKARATLAALLKARTMSELAADVRKAQVSRS